MELKIETIGKHHVIAPVLSEGEILSYEKIKSEVVNAIEFQKRHIVLDLAKIDYASSRMIGLFVSLQQICTKNKSHFTLLVPNPSLVDILESTGAVKLLTVIESRTQLDEASSRPATDTQPVSTDAPATPVAESAATQPPSAEQQPPILTQPPPQEPKAEEAQPIITPPPPQEPKAEEAQPIITPPPPQEPKAEDAQPIITPPPPQEPKAEEAQPIITPPPPQEPEAEDAQPIITPPPAPEKPETATSASATAASFVVEGNVPPAAPEAETGAATDAPAQTAETTTPAAAVPPEAPPEPTPDTTGTEPIEKRDAAESSWEITTDAAFPEESSEEPQAEDSQPAEDRSADEIMSSPPSPPEEAEETVVGAAPIEHTQEQMDRLVIRKDEEAAEEQNQPLEPPPSEQSEESVGEEADKEPPPPVETETGEAPAPVVTEEVESPPTIKILETPVEEAHESEETPVHRSLSESRWGKPGKRYRQEDSKSPVVRVLLGILLVAAIALIVGMWVYKANTMKKTGPAPTAEMTATERALMGEKTDDAPDATSAEKHFAQKTNVDKRKPAVKKPARRKPKRTVRRRRPAPPPEPAGESYEEPAGPQAGQGTIFIASRPALAEVFFRGRKIGVTNRAMLTLPVGRVSLTFRKNDYEVTREFEIQEGSNKSPYVDLTAAPPPPPPPPPASEGEASQGGEEPVVEDVLPTE